MQRGSLPLLAAAAIVLAVDGWYASLISAQADEGLGGLHEPRVWFVFAYLALAALLAGASAIARRHRRYLAAGAAAALLFMGVLTGFTIGQPLLLAAALVIVGFVRIGAGPADPAYRTSTALAVALLAIAVAVAGLMLT